MKMQVAFLPGGKFALVLSGVKIADTEESQRFASAARAAREEVGAEAVLVFADDVELDGFAALGPDEPPAMPDWTARVDRPLEEG